MIERLSISLADAQTIVDAVLAAAGPRTRPLAISVVDLAGDTVYQVRQDRTSAVDVHNAERKAYTAAFIGRDTSVWRAQIRHDGRTVADWSNRQLTTLHGGWTLRRASQVIGGLGVSGTGDDDRDEALALKGAEAAAQLAVAAWRTKRDPRPIRERSSR